MKSINNQGGGSKDVVYQQLYQEMRRYRDYQIVVSGWYATLAMGVIAGLFAIPKLDVNFGVCFAHLFSIFFILAGLGISYVIWYANNRYVSLKELANQIYSASPHEILVKPHHILILINLMLTIAGVIVVYTLT